MAIFKYKVRDKFGLLIRGRLEAVSVDAAASSLGSLHYTIINISEISEFEKWYLDTRLKLKRVTKKEVLLTIRQLSSMISAGLPIINCLNNVVNQTENPILKRIFGTVVKDIEGGETFADAMKKYPKHFSKFYIAMINVGEVGGKLDEILSRIAIIGKQESEIKSQLKSAMMYPLILLAVGLGVVLFLLVFILPKFIQIFDSFDVELPLPTVILLNVSKFLSSYWGFIIVAVIACVYFFKQYHKTQQGKFNIDQMILKVPVIGGMLLKYNIARFSRTLGSLLHSGIPIVQGIAVSQATINNYVLVTIMADLQETLLEGHNLSDQLRLSSLFPPMVIQMINTGEQTGKLDEMLLEVADFYDVEVDYEIKNLSTFVEPVLLIFMGLFVLFIALAVLKPIFNIANVAR